jgi:hypothetical protein
MMSANKLIAGIIAVTVAALCTGALVGGVLWGNSELSAVPAKFKVGDCYQKNGLVERWEAPVAGMVFDVGQASYLVVSHIGMRAKPIDRFVWAHERLIERFDVEFHKVNCPDIWR